MQRRKEFCRCEKIREEREEGEQLTDEVMAGGEPAADNVSSSSWFGHTAVGKLVVAFWR